MRTRISAVATAMCFLLSASSLCQGQTLTQTDWGGTTGTRPWHTGTNWVGGVAPNTVAPDPSLQIANLSVNLGAGLTVDLGATDARIAQLRLGSQSGAVATSVIGTGRLVFQNNDPSPFSATADADFDNNGTVDGRDFMIWQRGFGVTSTENINGRGDANGDFVVNAADLGIWRNQYGLGGGLFSIGAPGIESTGTAGVTNTIAAPIHILNERLAVAGTQDLTISGNISYEGDVAGDGTSNAGLAVRTLGQTVTLTGNIALTNADVGAPSAGDASDFYLNNDSTAQGRLVVQGLISGAGDLFVGTNQNGLRLPMATTVLSNANTHTGGTLASRGNLVLNNDQALGTGTYRVDGPANQYGYNMISENGDRTINNDITLAAWQTIRGQNSFNFSGNIEQTNNRGFVNLLPDGETLTFSGRVNIWEEQSDPNNPETIVRRFAVDGTGRTILAGTIHNDPLDTEPPQANLRQIYKTGTGSLLINMANSGDNNHSGHEIVVMGNLHYANNNSLNTHASAKILAMGGAVGVDVHPPGQNLASNTTFLNQIDPTSFGGLMLSATEDAATNLNFTSGSLVNAANMSVAAPETGITYTGTITPASSTYRLGGGTGTLTLPNAQLSGANALEVKNGGIVRLLGDNTYTGATTINTRYGSTGQEQAAVDEASDAAGIFYNRLVAPILEVDDLANGGAPSSIGSSINTAENLKLQGSTLRYVGTGDSTDRLFTIGTGGGTLDSSGTGAVVFSNSGALAIPDATDKIGTLDDYTGNPTEIINMNDTSDIIAGMTVSDPDPGGPAAFACGGGSTMNCIPAGTTVTGVSNDGKTIGLSSSFGFLWKMDTRLVFGPVARTLTLTGTNAQANILSGSIANSAKGGVVNIVKQGTGTWLLEGVSTSTGTTTVEQGTLGGNGGVGGALIVNSGATFAPGGTGASAIGDFSVGGSFTLNTGAILAVQLGGTTAGTYDAMSITGAATLRGVINLSAVSFTPAMGNQFTVLTAAGGITDGGLTISGLTGFTKSIVGNSLVLTKTAALSAIAAVPEPSALVLMGLAMAFVGARRK